MLRILDKYVVVGGANLTHEAIIHNSMYHTFLTVYILLTKSGETFNLLVGGKSGPGICNILRNHELIMKTFV